MGFLEAFLIWLGGAMFFAFLSGFLVTREGPPNDHLITLYWMAFFWPLSLPISILILIPFAAMWLGEGVAEWIMKDKDK